MNNKMAINAYLSTIASKKQTKETRRTERIMDTERICGCQMGWGYGAMGEDVRGLRSTSR